MRQRRKFPESRCGWERFIIAREKVRKEHYSCEIFIWVHKASHAALGGTRENIKSNRKENFLPTKNNKIIKVVKY